MSAQPAPTCATPGCKKPAQKRTRPGETGYLSKCSVSCGDSRSAPNPRSGASSGTRTPKHGGAGGGGSKPNSGNTTPRRGAGGGAPRPRSGSTTPTHGGAGAGAGPAARAPPMGADGASGSPGRAGLPKAPSSGGGSSNHSSRRNSFTGRGAATPRHEPVDRACVVLSNVALDVENDVVLQAVAALLAADDDLTTIKPVSANRIMAGNQRSMRVKVKFGCNRDATLSAAALDNATLFAGSTVQVTFGGAEAPRDLMEKSAKSEVLMLTALPQTMSFKGLKDLLRSKKISFQTGSLVLRPRRPHEGAGVGAVAFVNCGTEEAATTAVQIMKGLTVDGQVIDACLESQAQPSEYLGITTPGRGSTPQSGRSSGAATPRGDGLSSKAGSQVSTPALLYVYLSGFKGDASPQIVAQVQQALVTQFSQIAQLAVQQEQSGVAAQQSLPLLKIQSNNAHRLVMTFSSPDDAQLAVSELHGKVKLPDALQQDGVPFSATTSNVVQAGLAASTPPSRLVIVIGASLDSNMPLARAALILELGQMGVPNQGKLHERDVEIDTGRTIRLAFPTDAAAAAAVQSLNGNELIGTSVTAYLASADAPIMGGAGQLSNRGIAPGSALARDDTLSNQYRELRRLMTEAEFTHRIVAESVNAELLSPGLRAAYSPGYHESTRTPGLWLQGTIPRPWISVHLSKGEADAVAVDVVPNSLDDPKRLDLVTQSWKGEKLWLRGRGSSGVVAVWKLVTANGDGLVLEWLSGAEQPANRFVALSAVPGSVPVFGNTKAVCPDPSVMGDARQVGSFLPVVLEMWQQNDGGKLFKKSTHDWWVSGDPRCVESVHECFEFHRSGDGTTILRDLACSNMLKLSPTDLSMKRHDDADYNVLVQGGWVDAEQTKWSSTPQEAGAAPRQIASIHLQTRSGWNDCKWWAQTPTQEDGDGLTGVHIEKTRDDWSVVMQGGLTVGPDTAIEGDTGPAIVGAWVGDKPRTMWVLDAEAEGEADARAPIEDQIEMLVKQNTEFVTVRDELFKALATETNSPKAVKMLARLRREVARYQARLPAYGFRKALCETVRDNQVSILIGATGSGKSTQSLPFLVDQNIIKGRIACTQPRKVAAQSLADYVAQEWGGPVGGEVGLQVGGKRAVNKHVTRMVYQTEQMLLNNLVRDPLLKEYDAVVVDEAHERTIDQDLIFGFLKSVCAKRPEFRVIVASATIDPALFLTYFKIDEKAIIRIPGRTFPIDHHYEAFRPDALMKNPGIEVAKKTLDVIAMPGAQGDVLAFVPTPDDVDKATSHTEAALKRVNKEGVSYVLPLYGSLDADKQKRVFERTPTGKQKIVFTTNVAETSVTVDGVTVVIDCGLAKTAQYDAVRNMNRLEVRPITKSSAHQRAGRAGRTRPGQCFHLFSEDDFKEMPESVEPEIMRTELLGTILRLKELGIKDANKFDFIQQPVKSRVDSAEKQLRTFGFVDDNGDLTNDGIIACSLQIAPRYVHLLIKASELGVLPEALLAVGVLLANGKLTFRLKPADARDQVMLAAQARGNALKHPSGDFCTGYAAVFACKAMQRNARYDFAKNHGFVHKTLDSAIQFAASTARAIDREASGWDNKKKAAFAKLGAHSKRMPAPLTEDMAELLNRSFCSAFVDNLVVTNGPERGGMLLIRDVLEVEPSAEDTDESDEDDDDAASIDSAQSNLNLTDLLDALAACPLCGVDLENGVGGAVETFPCQSNPPHRCHRACRVLAGTYGGCPICRSNAAGPDGPAPPHDKTRKTVFVHPSSALFQGGNQQGGARRFGANIRTMADMQAAQQGAGAGGGAGASGWMAYGSLTETTKPFVQDTVQVNPEWPEVQNNVDVQKVQQDAKSVKRTVSIPQNIIGAFVGKGGDGLRTMEKMLNIMIVMPPRTNQGGGGHSINITIYGHADSIDDGTLAVEGRIAILQEEREAREQAYQEERARRQEEYEQRKAEREQERRHQREMWEQEKQRRQEEREEQRRRRQEEREEKQRQWEERQRQREIEHQLYLQRREAARQRAREQAEARRQRASRGRTYPYCGTPPGVRSRW